LFVNHKDKKELYGNGKRKHLSHDVPENVSEKTVKTYKRVVDTFLYTSDRPINTLFLVSIRQVFQKV
jgi:hypothetical protein